jgi:hypothetical protein
MADKELSILIKTTDTVSDVLKKIGAQAEQTAGKMAAAGKGKPSFFAEIGKQAETGTLSMGSFTAAATRALGPVALVGGAVAAVGGALAALTIKTASQGNMFDKLSQKTGVSVETLSGLQLVAAKSSMTIQDMGSAINKMQKAMFAAAGAGDKDKLFAALDIPVEVNGRLRDTNDVLMDLADKFQSMPDGAQKSALALKVFGKAGTEMIPIMNLGRVAIEEQIARANELGIVWSTEDAKAASQLHDKMIDLKSAIHGVSEEMGKSLIPAMTDIITKITELIEWVRKANENLRTFWGLVPNGLNLSGTAISGEGPFAESGVKGSLSPEQARQYALIHGKPYVDPNTIPNPRGMLGPPSPGPTLGPPTPTALPKIPDSGGRAAAPKTEKDITLNPPYQSERYASLQAYMDKLKAEGDAKIIRAGEETNTKLDELGDYQWQIERDKNQKILDEQKRFSDMYKEAGIAVWQGGTDIMAENLAKMIKGQKVGAKEMLKATGQMMGGVAVQMGTFYIAEGAAKVAESGWPPNPLSLEAGWGEIYAGMALKTLGALLSGTGGGAAGSKTGKGGGHEVPNRGAAATSIGSATVTFEGLERMRGRFVAGDYYDIVSDFIDKMNQAKRRDVHMEFAA